MDPSYFLTLGSSVNISYDWMMKYFLNFFTIKKMILLFHKNVGNVMDL